MLTPVTMFTQSFPSLFVAMLLLYFLGFSLGWFPLQHAYGDNVHPGLNGAEVMDGPDHAARRFHGVLHSVSPHDPGPLAPSGDQHGLG